ncbi:TIGR02450 family Trp-rich protein [Marinicella rhabdoformis]|uniref:TIGR02450 family Trp-rich protein n=1 Tax=Marinicella rhabdoformis TaxID=2580566 RepID=UPI0015CFA4FD
MNQINPKKLLHSKWTAVKPVNKEKHFIVTKLKLDEVGLVLYCEIEAVITKRAAEIDWKILQNQQHWLSGWQ